jgi:hypothetical protein
MDGVNEWCASCYRWQCIVCGKSIKESEVAVGAVASRGEHRFGVGSQFPLKDLEIGAIGPAIDLGKDRMGEEIHGVGVGRSHDCIVLILLTLVFDVELLELM